MNGDFKPARGREESSSVVPESPTKEQKIDDGSGFQTPEQVAADTGAAAEPLIEARHEEAVASIKKKTGQPWYKRIRELRPHWPPGRKEIIELIVVLLLIGAGSWLLFFHHSAPPAPKVAAKIVKHNVAPLTVPSNLTGLPVAPSVNSQPVTGVMIENTDAARPQSGLGQAGVVFEAVAEGGVTRFLALYQDTAPANIGPVRSARPYYVQWALAFDAGYAHVGGSPDALSDIKSWGVRDLDEFYNAGSYQRITTRAAPHNVYTAISTLNKLEDGKGYTTSTYTSWPRKADAPVKQPTAATINLTLSGPDYNPTYSYNTATNSYLRSEGGAPQIDANTNTQINPKVVIAMVIPKTQGALDASGAYYSDYTTIGSGPIDVFQDGTVTTGQWSKASNNGQLTFTAADGTPIKLDAGRTWLSAVSAASAISYTP